jgi:hypothetical protein
MYLHLNFEWDNVFEQEQRPNRIPGKYRAVSPGPYQACSLLKFQAFINFLMEIKMKRNKIFIFLPTYIDEKYQYI